MKTSVEHVANEGNKCPHCGDNNIELEDASSIEGVVLFQGMTCVSCGQKWKDEYRLVGLIAKEGE